VRSDKEIETVILMRIAEDLKIATLILLACLTSLIALSTGIYTLHLTREMLDALLISSQIAVAVGTIFLAFMTAKSVEELKVERLRKSFKAIAKELHRAKDYVERNLKKAHKVVILFYEIPLGSGDPLKNVIRKDFELHYRKGIKLLNDIEKCNSKIKENNKKHGEFIGWLRGFIVEKLKERGICVDPNESNYFEHETRTGDVQRILLFRNVKECEKELPKASHVLSIDDRGRVFLVDLDNVLRAREGEEELSKELASLYQEIRSSDKFRGYLGDLEHKVEKEVKPCLEKLRDELDKVIDDIMRRYALSEQEVATKED